MTFQPIDSKVDVAALEREVQKLWKDTDAFEKRRRLNEGKPKWSFIDGPITANNPMGVHHAWGRTYKDLWQRYWAMRGRDIRYQNGFDCQGLWVEVEVEKDLGFQTKRDIEAYGIAEFVVKCKQRVLNYSARQTEQSIRLGYWCDWNNPDELTKARRGDEQPTPADDLHRLTRTHHRHRRVPRRTARHAPGRRKLLHTQRREQLHDLDRPQELPRPRLDIQGTRLHALVPPMQHRHQPTRDSHRGLQGDHAHNRLRQVPPQGTEKARYSSGRRPPGRSRATSPSPPTPTSPTSKSSTATRYST